MSANDPLRRHELAQRLERLRAGQDPDDGDRSRRQPASWEGAPARRLGPTTGELAAMIEAAAEELVARRSGQEQAPSGAESPAETSWQHRWWDQGTATDRARETFLGEDGWALAWVLHRDTGLPLVVVEERLAGARNHVWLQRHVLVEAADGWYLDVAGVQDRRTLLERHASTRGARCRVVPLPQDVHVADLLDRRHGPGTATQRPARWQDALSVAPPEAVELVARELAARHASRWSATPSTPPVRPGVPRPATRTGRARRLPSWTMGSPAWGDRTQG